MTTGIPIKERTLTSAIKREEKREDIERKKKDMVIKAKNALIAAINNIEKEKIVSEQIDNEKVGKILPVPNTLRQIKCKNAKEGVFTMKSTDQEVRANYIDGDVVITHNEQERLNVRRNLRTLKCRVGRYAFQPI